MDREGRVEKDRQRERKGGVEGNREGAIRREGWVERGTLVKRYLIDGGSLVIHGNSLVRQLSFYHSKKQEDEPQSWCEQFDKLVKVRQKQQ